MKRSLPLSPKSSKKTDFQELLELREKNAKLRTKIQFYGTENFEYLLQINRMKNNLREVNQIKQNTIPVVQKFISSVLQTESTNLLSNQTNAAATNGNNSNHTPARPNLSALHDSLSFNHHKSPNDGKFVNTRKGRANNRTHVAAPHRVNGHVICSPVINLQRVSDVQAEASNTE